MLHSFNGRWIAKVRADGTLISADHRGSIHQVGAAVQARRPVTAGPSVLKVDGQLVSIDTCARRCGRIELAG